MLISINDQKKIFMILGKGKTKSGSTVKANLAWDFDEYV